MLIQLPFYFAGKRCQRTIGADGEETQPSRTATIRKNRLVDLVIDPPAKGSITRSATTLISRTMLNATEGQPMSEKFKSGAELRNSSRWTKKLLLLALVLVGAAAIYSQFRDVLSIEFLASQETQLRQWQVDFPLLTAVAAVAIYVVVAGMSFPVGTALTLVCGWYFGFWEGLLVVSFGSTGGAMLAFLISRYLLRDWAQSKMQDRLAGINEAFEREGAFYLFTLRIVPAVPFFVVNAVMGLTKVRASTFWWVSQIGMLPGTAAYVYAGSTVPSLTTLAREGVGSVLSWQLVVAFVIIGVLPLVIKRIVSFVGRNRCAGWA